ncbi:MAG: hypothetical protein WD250_14040 [Egibacteraceae bacterium]
MTHHTTEADARVPSPTGDIPSMWSELAEYARRAPSPHNTQPTRLRVLDRERAHLLFVTERGLPVGDLEGRFACVTCGIVVESLRIAAHARGYALEAEYTGGPLYEERPDGLRKVADLRLVPRGHQIDDLDPALLHRRRTNRQPYNDRPIPAAVIGQLREEAARHGHTFTVSVDPMAVRWVKELNRDALYHDLEHDRFRQELGSWLRYSQRQARQAGDGLSPGALVLPGWLLQGFMRYHRLFSAPVVKQLTQRVYMRTMTGISTVGWLQGSFVDAEDWIGAGHLMLRLWLILTEHGIDWQPYGSIITNEEFRGSMVDKFGMREGEGGRDMVWLLVRMGYSDHEPVPSERLPLSAVIQ